MERFIIVFSVLLSIFVNCHDEKFKNTNTEQLPNPNKLLVIKPEKFSPTTSISLFIAATF